MKQTVGMKIGAGVALALAFLLIIGVISYRSTASLMENVQARGRTFRNMIEVRDYLGAVKDAEIGQRGYLLTGEDRSLTVYRTALQQLERLSLSTRALMADNPNQLRRLDDLAPLLKEKLDELAETIALRKEKGLEVALAVVKSERGTRAMDGIRRLVDDIGQEENRLVLERTANVDTSSRTALAVLSYGIPSAFILLGILALLLTRNISLPLREVTDFAERLARGDLTQSLAASVRGDEIGALRQAFGRMADNLRTQIREISEGAAVLLTAVSEIAATTSELAASTTESATAVRETSVTAQEVNQTAQVTRQKAQYVSDSAQKAAQVALGGRTATAETATVMNGIREQMGAITDTILRLGEQSQTIGEIMASVNDLAEQSNLLAVNAAIEAAKAGEQGKGFAVVAQEVKSLAEQSKGATAQVRTILNDVQKAISISVMATEQGSKVVEAGVAQATQAGESIQMLADGVTAAANAAVQIAASSEQQSVGMDQMTAALESIKEASGQNVESARQLEAAARNLANLGQQLNLSVSRYQV